MQTKNHRFGTRQRGQGMTEYIIITVLIAIAAIAAFTFFGGTIRSQIGGMARELSGETASSSIQKAQAASKKAESEGGKNKTLGSYQNDNAR